MTDTFAPHSTCSGCTRRSVLIGVGAAATAAAAGCASGSAESTPLRVALAEIPVGGGQVFTRERLVVTQPTHGEIRAFSTVCPHQGCTVGRVADGIIECPCHGSKFDIADGSVLRGPAREPLEARSVTKEETEIVVR
ncbi:Rieske (2Fe-2S) protein [Nocardia gipuzkoensis]|uniref:QcrA and Rieske domain-containing protein n=1 Tax=Nocardia gipuzkoensis TaxID=2749991 RepID=UPI001E4270B4|nr:Rieske (2Fe-2S) protein [Nocardia gipuzkoensis]UGT67935.1 Rieske (2Fe-2S) protein [Nocardia gipuzkoensis]